MKTALWTATSATVAAVLAGCAAQMADAKPEPTAPRAPAAVVVSNQSRINSAKRKMDSRVANYMSSEAFSQATQYLQDPELTGIGEVDSAIEAYAERLLRTKVAPAWTAQIISIVRPYIARAVEAGNYEKAREVLWRAPSTNNDDVNAGVRAFCVEQMRTIVNPAHWRAIETEFRTKLAAFDKAKDYVKAVEWINAYPRVRTYSTKLDEKLKTVEGELVKLGIDEANTAPILVATRKLVADAARIVDMTDMTPSLGTAKVSDTSGALPDLESYRKRLEEYKKMLIRHDCTEEAAKDIIAKFDSDVAPLLKPLVKPVRGGVREIKGQLQLGTGGLNARIEGLRAASLADFEARKTKYLAEKHEKDIAELARKVTAAVAEKRYAQARELVLNVPLAGDPAWDARMCAVRIGLLNSVINPNQFATLAAEIDKKADKLYAAGDYEEFRDYAASYPYVHDSYRSVIDALGRVKAAMLGLEIGQDAAENRVGEISGRVRDILEARTGMWNAGSDRDCTELEKSLGELGASLAAQNYSPQDVQAFCEEVRKEILALVSKAPAPMTTGEMNAALKAKLEQRLENIDNLIARRDAARAESEYAEMLAAMDAEFSFDSQISLAEDAIARQIAADGPDAGRSVNSLLGEYARTMRHMKLGRPLDQSQKAALLLGAIYLDQSAVVERALKLGADVNGTTSRDPLKRTSVLIAVQSGHSAYLKRLAKANASLSVADAAGDSALHYAARGGNVAVIKAMLAKIPVDVRNAAGETPLFDAARRDSAAAVEALAAANADVKVVDSKGSTAFDAACRAGSRNVLDALAGAGAEYGDKQLRIAAASDALAVAQWLVGRGADVNSPGVMDAVPAGSETERYLIRQGGTPKKRATP